MSDTKPKAYLAWFCPFARRAWVSLLAKKVDFEYIEQNPYNKTKEWMSISKGTGLVPVLLHNGNTIYESGPCIEYVDEAFDTDVSLMPKDPYQRAYARIWGAFIGNKLIPHIFGMVMKPTDEQKQESKEKFLEGIKEFSNAMKPESVYFQGDTLSYVDIMFGSFCAYYPIMKEWASFEIPRTPEFERFHNWLDAIQKHPAVAATSPDPEKFKTFSTMYFEARKQGKKPQL